MVRLTRTGKTDLRDTVAREGRGERFDPLCRRARMAPRSAGTASKIRLRICACSSSRSRMECTTRLIFSRAFRVPSHAGTRRQLFQNALGLQVEHILRAKLGGGLQSSCLRTQPGQRWVPRRLHGAAIGRSNLQPRSGLRDAVAPPLPTLHLPMCRYGCRDLVSCSRRRPG